MAGDGYTFLGQPTGTTSGTVAAGNHTHTLTAANFDAPSDRGLLAWSYPVIAAAGGSALSPAGTMHVTRVRRSPAGSVTNIITYLTANGSGLTSGQCFAALYSAAGDLIGVTADQATAWGALGLKTMALVGGPYPVSAGDLYVAMWYNGTTGPSVVRGGSVSSALSNVGLSAPNFAHATANTGLTTTAPSTIGTMSVGVFQWWVAVS